MTTPNELHRTKARIRKRRESRKWSEWAKRLQRVLGRHDRWLGRAHYFAMRAP